MPKAQGTKPTIALSISEDKFERQFKRKENLEEKVRKIEQALEQIEDERERTVLECIMDGERMNIIAKHVGVSRTRLNEIKRAIVIYAAKVLYPEEMQR
jgi:FixJ family two-component response regulator